MSRVVITAQQVKAALEATGYSSIDSNIEMITIRIEKTRGHKWNETGTFALEFPKSELRKRVYDCQLDKDGDGYVAQGDIPVEHELNIEFGRLQLEQATWAESNRVDQVARSRLGMVFPRTEDIVVLRR